MTRLPRILATISLLALAVTAAHGQSPNTPPGTAQRRGGPGVESGPGTAYKSPEVNANGSITFRLLAPNAKVVRVITDMPKIGEVTSDGANGYDMTKDDKGIWSYTTPKLTPSYYQYWFELDGLTMPDPMNTFVRPATGKPGVYKSIVALPGKEAEFMMFRDVPHGNLTEHMFLSKETDTARRVVVYTPPDYNTSGKSYPVIYLLHGNNDSERGWTQSGMANTIMDNLIAEDKAIPAIVVMPFGHDVTTSTGKVAEITALQESLGYTPTRGGRGGAGVGGGGFGAGGGLSGTGWTMEKELINYVMPYVEKDFRVIKDKQHRAIFGYSMGGGHATSIGFAHPELFDYVGGFSGGAVPDSLLADPAKANKDFKMIFFGVGSDDPIARSSTITANTRLTEKNINHIFSEDAGYGHDYQIWRKYLYRLAQQTFRD